MANYTIDRIEFGDNTYILKDSTSGYIAGTSAFTGKPSANAAPSFGGAFTISQIAQNSKAQVSGTDRTITIPSTLATYNTRGLVQPLFSNSAVATGAAATSSSVSVSVQARGTTSNRFYGVEADSAGHLYVNVPWTDTNTKVSQYYTTTSSSYPLLFSYTAGTSSEGNRGAQYARLVNSIYAVPSTGTIYTNSFKSLDTVAAERGVFNKIIATSASIGDLDVNNLTAQNATVVGLLDVKGELHTNKWTNANIANIGGSFYISPTVSTEYASDSVMNVNISTASDSSYTMAVSSGAFETSIVKVYDETREEDVPLETWPVESRVMVTGNIRVGDNGVDYPLGTCTGYLSAALDSEGHGFTVSGIKSAALESIVSETGSTSFKSKKIQISMYEIGGSSSGTKPVGIMMQSYGVDNSTYMDVYGGVNIRNATFPFAVNPNVRVGYLGDLPPLVINGVGHKPVGWGIYTDNGYFQGLIIASSGIIGGWEINTQYLASSRTFQDATTSTVDETFIFLSNGESGESLEVLGTTSSKWSIKIGNSFGVLEDGSAYMGRAIIKVGDIGPFALNDDGLSYRDDTNHQVITMSKTGFSFGENDSIYIDATGRMYIGAEAGSSTISGNETYNYLDYNDSTHLINFFFNNGKISNANIINSTLTTSTVTTLNGSTVNISSLYLDGVGRDIEVGQFISQLNSNVLSLSGYLNTSFYLKSEIDTKVTNLTNLINSTSDNIIETYNLNQILSFVHFTGNDMYIGPTGTSILKFSSSNAEAIGTSIGAELIFFTNSESVKAWALRRGAEVVSGKPNLNDVWIGG